MGLVKEFKEFAVRGNVIDLAVGVIIGGAFGKIVSSLVEDVIMPPLGFIIGGVDFTALKAVLKHAPDGAAAVTLNYGKFLQTTFDFTVVAFAVFLMVKGINAMKKNLEREKQQAPPAPPTTTESLLQEIRDLLKQGR